MLPNFANLKINVLQPHTVPLDADKRVSECEHSGQLKRQDIGPTTLPADEIRAIFTDIDIFFLIITFCRRVDPVAISNISILNKDIFQFVASLGWTLREHVYDIPLMAGNEAFKKRRILHTGRSYSGNDGKKHQYISKIFKGLGVDFGPQGHVDASQSDKNGADKSHENKDDFHRIRVENIKPANVFTSYDGHEKITLKQDGKNTTLKTRMEVYLLGREYKLITNGSPLSETAVYCSADNHSVHRYMGVLANALQEHACEVIDFNDKWDEYRRKQLKSADFTRLAQDKQKMVKVAALASRAYDLVKTWIKCRLSEGFYNKGTVREFWYVCASGNFAALTFDGFDENGLKNVLMKEMNDDFTIHGDYTEVEQLMAMRAAVSSVVSNPENDLFRSTCFDRYTISVCCDEIDKWREVNMTGPQGKDLEKILPTDGVVDFQKLKCILKKEELDVLHAFGGYIDLEKIDKNKFKRQRLVAEKKEENEATNEIKKTVFKYILENPKTTAVLQTVDSLHQHTRAGFFWTKVKLTEEEKEKRATNLFGEYLPADVIDAKNRVDDWLHGHRFYGTVGIESYKKENPTLTAEQCGEDMHILNIKVGTLYKLRESENCYFEARCGVLWDRKDGEKEPDFYDTLMPDLYTVLTTLVTIFAKKRKDPKRITFEVANAAMDAQNESPHPNDEALGHAYDECETRGAWMLVKGKTPQMVKDITGMADWDKIFKYSEIFVEGKVRCREGGVSCFEVLRQKGENCLEDRLTKKNDIEGIRIKQKGMEVDRRGEIRTKGKPHLFLPSMKGIGTNFFETIFDKYATAIDGIPPGNNYQPRKRAPFRTCDYINTNYMSWPAFEGDVTEFYYLIPAQPKQIEPDQIKPPIRIDLSCYFARRGSQNCFQSDISINAPYPLIEGRDKYVWWDPIATLDFLLHYHGSAANIAGKRMSIENRNKNKRMSNAKLVPIEDFYFKDIFIINPVDERNKSIIIAIEEEAKFKDYEAGRLKNESITDEEKEKFAKHLIIKVKQEYDRAKQAYLNESVTQRRDLSEQERAYLYFIRDIVFQTLQKNGKYIVTDEKRTKLNALKQLCAPATTAPATTATADPMVVDSTQ